MTSVLPRCAPTMIGSLPHTEVQAAVALVDSLLVEVPALCELPRLGPRQDMIGMHLMGLPGLRQGREGKPFLDTSADRTQLELAEFFERAMAAEASGDFSAFALDAEHAAAVEPFYRTIASRRSRPPFIKMQCVGPLTFSLELKDETGRPLFFNDTFREALAYQIKWQSAWLLQKLEPLAEKPIFFLDEPYLAAFGSSALLGISHKQVLDNLRPLVDFLKGRGALVGTHVCGNTDWAMLIDCGLDILNCDAFNFGRQFVIYAPQLGRFLAEGGLIAWGIVPNNEKVMEHDAASLEERLLELVDELTDSNLSRKDILGRSFVTPSCGLAGLESGQAIRVLELTASLSNLLRRELLTFW
jgi:hypothetical protein